jgi:hypothetical protein
LITATDHVLFDSAYEMLWREFQPHDSMETRQVLHARCQWQHRTRPRFWYEMIALTAGDTLAAVRDQSAVVTAGGEVVVHLSHVLISPTYRGSGLAGWLRAWPILTARRLAAAAGLAGDTPITLVAEMEHPDPADPAAMHRLRSYQRAGFLKADPTRCNYHQPDFRDPDLIDAAGGAKPLPYGLILRCIGKEDCTHLSGRQLRGIIDALYAIYGQSFRPHDMEIARQTLGELPGDDETVNLLPPTS